MCLVATALCRRVFTPGNAAVSVRGYRTSRRSEAATTSLRRVHQLQRTRIAMRIPFCIALPKCRMIRHNSRSAAFNRFPFATPGMITVKLRTFGFLAVALAGLLFLPVRWVPDAACAPAAAGAAELKITQDIIPPGKCGRPLHRPMRPTFITIHSTDNRSRSADALNHALAMNKGLRGRHNALDFSPGISLWTIIPFTKLSRLTKPESMLITKARETGRPSGSRCV